MSKGISALFGTEKNIIELLAKFRVYRLGLGQENIMVAISTNFATLVLFCDQCKHQKGVQFYHIPPILVLILVVKQNQRRKINADCTHNVLLSKTHPVNFEFCEYLDYIFLGTKKSQIFPRHGSELCKIWKCFKLFLRKKAFGLALNMFLHHTSASVCLKVDYYEKNRENIILTWHPKR